MIYIIWDKSLLCGYILHIVFIKLFWLSFWFYDDRPDKECKTALIYVVIMHWYISCIEQIIILKMDWCTFAELIHGPRCPLKPMHLQILLMVKHMECISRECYIGFLATSMQNECYMYAAAWGGRIWIWAHLIAMRLHGIQ